MRIIGKWIAIALILCGVQAASGQETAANRLYIPELQAQKGKVAAIPVFIDNIEQVGAIQMDVTLPAAVQPTGALTIADRASGLTIVIQAQGANTWRILGYSPADVPLAGNNGVAFYILADISQSVSEGERLPITLDQVILAQITGEPIVCTYSAGDIIIAQSPDLAPSEVKTDRSQVGPGDDFTVSYLVSNLGSFATNSGWSETVVLSDGTQSRTIAACHYSLSLSGGSSVQREIEAKMPELPTMDGPCYIEVKLNPDADCGEPSTARGNNTATSAQPLTVLKALTLTPETTRLRERHTTKVRCKATRSGNLSEAQDFVLTKTPEDSRLLMPQTVTIASNQSSVYFNIDVSDNDTLDSDTICSISISGNEYPAAITQLVIIDDELPTMVLSASKDRVEEGDSLMLTATSEIAANTDVVISLYCDYPEKFAYPTTITLPAGKTSVDAKVVAIDNKKAENAVLALFEISAEGYETQNCVVDLIDNDVPQITMTLTTDTIAENQGRNAVQGKIQRSTLVDERATVMLSDDSKGRFTLSSHAITFKVGETEKTFSIDVNDNSQVDTEDTYEITAGVYLTECGCQASHTSVGAAKVQLTVVDDDGNSLQVTPSSKSWREGYADGYVTIARNTSPVEPLIVALTCDNPQLVAIPATVEIPQGETAVKVPVEVLTNSVSDDETVVNITATAPEYAQGRNWVRIVDYSRPDAVITNIALTDTIVEANGTVTATVTVHNDGVATMPKNTLVQFHTDTQSYAISAYTQAPLEPGQECTVARNIYMPDKVGKFAVYSTVNADSQFAELDSLNNQSTTCHISVVSGVSAQVSTDKAVYDSGEPVVVTGVLSGNNISNKTIDVYVTNGVYRQTFAATTDSLGHFVYTFAPYASQIGRLNIGACYPGEQKCDNEAEINIYGLETSLTTNKVEIDQNEKTTLKLRLNNPTTLPITGVEIQTQNCPDNCQISIGSITELKAGGYVEVPITLTGTEPSVGSSWHLIGINLSADNGIHANKTLYYYCHTPIGKLHTDFAPVNTTIPQTTTRDYTVYLQNRGKGETGAITVSLPDVEWIKSVTPMQLPSLQSGEACSMVLRMIGDESMQLNVTNHCTVAVNCANSDGLLLYFTAKCVSETKGNLIVDVCDEYTYSEPTAPRVAGASVVLRDPSTGAVAYTGVSDENGRYEAEIPAGLYTLNVSADKHYDTTYSIEVLAGEPNKEVANISVKGVTVDVTFYKDEVTETYETEVVSNFETNVPIPVVIMEGPTRVDGDAMAVGESLILNYTLKNYGMVQAENVYLQIPTGSDEFTLEPLVSVGPFSLAPEETAAMPILLTRISDGVNKAPRRAPMRADDYDDLNYTADWLPKTNDAYFNNCMAGMAYWYHHNCGGELKDNKGALRLAVKACMSGSIGSAMATYYANYGTTCSTGGNNVWPDIYPDNPQPGDPYSENFGYYDPSADSQYDILRRKTNICNPAIADCSDWIITETASACDDTGIVSFSIATMDGYADAVGREEDPTAGAMEAALNNLLEQVGMGLNNCASDDEDEDDEDDDENSCNPFDMIAEARQSNELATNLEGCLEAVRQRNQAFRDLEAMQNQGQYRAASADDVQFDIVPSWMQAYVEALDAYVEMLDLRANMYTEVFGNRVWFTQDVPQIGQFMKALGALNKSDITVDNLASYRPTNISEEDFALFVERQYNTANHLAADNAVDLGRLTQMTAQKSELDSKAQTLGYDNVSEWYREALHEFYRNYNEEEESVCASVGIALSQSVAVTREVVRGIMEVYNGNEDEPLRKLRLSVKILDQEGNLANQKFVITTDSADGFVDGGDNIEGFTLSPGASGRLNLIFVPKTDAEMSEPVNYEFGGVVTYVDPYLGSTTTIELYPTVLTINPSPILDMTYFLQRDVIGDDPLTTDVVEPSEPAEFSLLINNCGHGDALDVNIVTHKPQIVRNDNNLAISDFELVSSCLQGREASLPVDGEITTPFGSIPAHELKFAQWWFRSALLGHFIDYDVNLVKGSQYSTEASLISQLSVHELIRSLDISREDESVTLGFLVNDIVDSNDLPDHLYVTDGNIHSVSRAHNPRIAKVAEMQYRLTFDSDSASWTYGKTVDPTNGTAIITSVIRDADDSEVAVRNFWTTNVTLRDGKAPLHENILHFADSVCSAGPCSYTLTFAEKAAEGLCLKSINGISDNLEGYVECFILTFSKDVDQSTFGPENITFTKDGQPLVGDIDVIWIDDSQCQVILSELARRKGQYTITISMDGVTATDGTVATGSSTYSWTMLADANVEIVSGHGYHLVTTLVSDSACVVGEISANNYYSIYSMTGLLVGVGSVNADGAVDVSTLPNGNYVLCLNCDGAFAALRFVKHTRFKR